MPQRIHTYRGTIKVYIDTETCTACELCYDAMPDIFSNRGDGIPIVLYKNIKEDDIPRLESIAQDCPSGSIILEVG